MSVKKTQKNKNLIKRFLPYLIPEKKTIVIDLICATLTTLCEIALPLIAGKLTDAQTGADVSGITWTLILNVVIFYTVLTLIDAGANYFMLWRGHVMGTRIENHMRKDLFAKLHELPFSFYDNAKVGQLMSRLTSDLFDITEFSHHCPEEVFMTVIKIGASFFIFSKINIWLFLAVLAVFPVMVLITKRVRRKMREAFSQRRKEIGEINACAEDSLLGVRVVKSFTNEDEENRKFGGNANKYFEVKDKSYRYMALFHMTTKLSNNLIYIAVVGVGAAFLMQGKLTPGEFTTALLMVNTLVSSIRRILDFSEQFSEGMTGIERFTEIMDEASEEKDSPDAVELESVKGEIELKGVSFKYGGTDKNVLEGLDLLIKPGENVALVGPSGGGKTTICNIIPRFYEIQSGEILIDGKNVHDIKRKSLRENIGIVQQDVYLFAGTIRENITYGKMDATEEEIIAAAKRAGAHEFICSLPNGYDTYVGERGVKLSGGQKQRVSIARVFLKNPPILILDEATSALDNESERLVQNSLEELAKGRTTLVIAHRLTTVINADEILVLTEDGVVEKGSHKELIQKGGMYAEMYGLYSV